MSDGSTHGGRDKTSHGAVVFVVGLVIAGLVLLTLFGSGAGDRALDRSPVGMRALGAWLQQAGLPARISHPRLHPRVEDLGLRVLPLYDIDLEYEDDPPESLEERMNNASLRDIDLDNFTTKISEIPTVVLLPKWRGAMVETGIAHEQSLIPSGALQRLKKQIGLETAGLHRGGPQFTEVEVAPGQTIALFHAQTFTASTLPKHCRPELNFAGGVLIMACDQEEAAFPVYFVADPDLMNNHGLGIADNAGFVPTLLKRLRGDADLPVYIDNSPDLLTTIERDDERQDYSRGYEEFARFFDYPFTVFWAALLMVLAVLFWRGAARFGPLDTGERFAVERSKRAAITAKARLLRLSGSDGRMVADFVRSQLNDLALRSFGGQPTQDAERRFLTLIARRDPDLARDFGALADDLMQNAARMPEAQLHRNLAHYHSLLKRVVTIHGSV
ncbi:hypothetical protein QKW60_08355 [Defluviimonas aestuarii]|uniref:hypothetical protein n=1 Tax=Albidovulum aestuarii TaxID=1130726 RepID=UPI00249AF148|nr:hypothetical protein [Defluviimonas aestuarii]MDI3336413.1 hypothetical protein [Defluviimonas aestuarii]